jgi:hypothetical protein
MMKLAEQTAASAPYGIIGPGFDKVNRKWQYRLQYVKDHGILPDRGLLKDAITFFPLWVSVGRFCKTLLPLVCDLLPLAYPITADTLLLELGKVQNVEIINVKTRRAAAGAVMASDNGIGLSYGL